MTAALQDAVVVETARTPMGRYGGQIAGLRPDDLAATAVAEALRRAGVRGEDVQDVILGCANQAGEDNRTSGAWRCCWPGFRSRCPGRP